MARISHIYRLEKSSGYAKYYMILAKSRYLTLIERYQSLCRKMTEFYRIYWLCYLLMRCGFLSCVSDMGVKYMFPNKYLLVRPDLTCAFRPKRETGIRRGVCFNGFTEREKKWSPVSELNYNCESTYYLTLPNLLRCTQPTYAQSCALFSRFYVTLFQYASIACQSFFSCENLTCHGGFYIILINSILVGVCNAMSWYRLYHSIPVLRYGFL
jgi:hypothetical protein